MLITLEWTKNYIKFDKNLNQHVFVGIRFVVVLVFFVSTANIFFSSHTEKFFLFSIRRCYSYDWIRLDTEFSLDGLFITFSSSTNHEFPWKSQIKDFLSLRRMQSSLSLIFLHMEILEVIIWKWDANAYTQIIIRRLLRRSKS